MSRKYTKEHEWIEVSGDVATIGITHFAQAELGDLVFVDLPEIGKNIGKGDSICVVESTKAASDVYAPVSGNVSEVNSALKDQPELINSDPYSAGWIVKIKGFSASELENLMDEQAYKAHIGE